MIHYAVEWCVNMLKAHCRKGANESGTDHPGLGLLALDLRRAVLRLRYFWPPKGN